MTVHQTTLISVDCDIKGCGHTIACGSDWSFAENNGWKLDVPIDDSHKDLCPECYADLKAFTDGDPEDEADIMNLRDVLAGEQPRPGEEDRDFPMPEPAPPEEYMPADLDDEKDMRL